MEPRPRISGVEMVFRGTVSVVQRTLLIKGDPEAILTDIDVICTMALSFLKDSPTHPRSNAHAIAERFKRAAKSSRSIIAGKLTLESKLANLRGLWKGADTKLKANEAHIRNEMVKTFLEIAESKDNPPTKP